MLSKAAEERIDGILLEGGGTINEAFLHEGLVNEVYAFIAPKLVGGADAKTPVEGRGIGQMAEALCLERTEIRQVGEDVLVHGLVKQ